LYTKIKQVKQSFSYHPLNVFLIALIVSVLSCSKSGGGGGTPDPCSGLTIAVTGTVTHPVTGSNNGAITVSATGGSSGFTFSLNGGVFQSAGNFTGLAAGSYTVVAKNAGGCTGSASFTLVATNPCAGVTIAVTATTTNPTSMIATNGSISATATGSSGFSFSLNGGTFQASGNFTNLASGAYTIVAKDVNGCTGSALFTLTTPNLCTGITITVTGTTVNPAPATSNGSIAATAAGSTGFTFNINGGAFQASGNFTNLAAGSYTIVAKDLNGCTGSAVFTLTAPNPCAGITISVTSVVTANKPCEAANNGSVTGTGAGGTAPYTFSINGGAFQASNIFPGLAAATYSITAKDANGCSGTASATVSNQAAGPLFLAVRNLLNDNCVGCHNNTLSEGGMNWTVDCNIVSFRERINQRAVHASPSAMPPTGLLPAAERNKITNWINAGGRFTD
jgi:hypothetical protein